MDLQIDGKRALISGATSGIGLAIATALAREGAVVAVTGRSREKLQRARQSIEISARADAAIMTVAADLGTAAGVETVIAALPDVDILVNNLGIYEASRSSS